MPGSFFQVESKKVQTLTEFLESDSLNLAENFLKEFEAMEVTQQIEQVKKLIADGKHFDFIAKLATVNDRFKKVCNLAQFKNTWFSCWSTYGLLITQDSGNSLFLQPCKNALELFLGIFYYYKALKTAEILKVNYSQIEINYLKQAIIFNSVHACQRYYAYLYENIKANFNNTPTDDVKLQFRDIIKNIKQNILPYYGSYAYFMLTEAYFYYGIYLKEKGELEFACKSLNSALKSLDFAQSERLKEADQQLYHNASLGNMECKDSSFTFTSLNKIRILILKHKASISSRLASTGPQVSSLFAEQESQKTSLKLDKSEFNSESETLILKCQPSLC
ncbi:DUF5630 domain-containing protein [Legionella gresilensis]|uniref:DUF5630 domain-containing protein n=1 Tax=Legionella gresilensis TaxID=91823 RepID=UPI0010411030|nr:DUF5630 domain-containing protein [Legionella gresilensis]